MPAHFHLLVKLHLAFPEFLLRFFQNCMARASSSTPLIIGYINAHPSKRAGPEDGPQLLLEQLRVLQAEADRPESPETDWSRGGSARERPPSGLSPPRSSVRMTTGFGAKAATTAR